MLRSILGMLGLSQEGFWEQFGYLCIASVIRCIRVLFQVRPKFVQIPNQSLFCRWCLAMVALPFSCRGGGRAERVKFAVPKRGAGVVLNGSVKSSVPEGLLRRKLQGKESAFGGRGGTPPK